MSYGYGSQIQATLNRNKHKTSKTFKKIKGTRKVNYSEVYFDKKATPHQLKKIRERMQIENRKRFIQKLVVILISLAMIIYIVIFAKF